MSATFFEVCAGCGGMSRGFLDAGFVCLGLNEVDPVCCRTLRKNHPSIPIIEKDMKELLSDGFVLPERPDVLIGGIPCQSFSQAGNRKGLNDPRGNLMTVFTDIVRKWEPALFVIENVRGLVTHDGGRTIERVVDGLRLGGSYAVQHKVLNAWDYRVPQKRERVFIIGVRSGSGIRFEYPPADPSRPVLRDVLPLAITNHAGAQYPEKKREIMRLIPPGGCWVNLPDDIKRRYMGKSIDSGGGKRGVARRLSMDEPSLTLTTSPCQKQTERCHPSEDRPLSVQEYAAIQTFPPSFEFCGSVNQQYRQIGNAVPCNLALALATSVLQALSSQNL